MLDPVHERPVPSPIRTSAGPLLLAALMVTAGFAGCLGGGPAGSAQPDSTDGTASSNASASTEVGHANQTPPTVIAVPDTGINPYHDVFQGSPTFADVPGFPDDAEALALSRDAQDYTAAFDADLEEWQSIEREELVWFPGTRLAAISFGAHVDGPVPEVGPVGDDVDNPPARIIDGDGHGTLTSHSVLAAGENVVVVQIQTPDDENLTEALLWAADQDWIDLVSVSWGTWLFEYPQGEILMGLASAYRAAFDSGKLVFNGIGNTPKPHQDQETSAPPFVIGVGGSQNATHGESEIAAKFPDIVAPFVQRRAWIETFDDQITVSGTSLSGPYAAGSVGQALYEVRRSVNATSTGAGPLVERQGPGALEDGTLTKEELWRAINASAVQWGAEEWRPLADDPRPIGGDLGHGIPVASAAVQMGWGQVTPEVTDRIADILLGEAGPRDKVPGTAATMDAMDAIARMIWNSLLGEEASVEALER